MKNLNMHLRSLTVNATGLEPDSKVNRTAKAGGRILRIDNITYTLVVGRPPLSQSLTDSPE